MNGNFLMGKFIIYFAYHRILEHISKYAGQLIIFQLHGYHIFKFIQICPNYNDSTRNGYIGMEKIIDG
jgi:hypothetical protein